MEDDKCRTVSPPESRATSKTTILHGNTMVKRDVDHYKTSSAVKIN
jgi:hypothetical protein